MHVSVKYRLPWLNKLNKGYNKTINNNSQKKNAKQYSTLKFIFNNTQKFF